MDHHSMLFSTLAGCSQLTIVSIILVSFTELSHPMVSLFHMLISFLE